MYSGQVQSVYKKYTVNSTGIWERIRRFLAIDPNRSSGVPLVPIYRNPAPGTVPPLDYKDPVTVPAADLADNPYWKRDTRRQYPRLALYTQQDVVGLLELGSKAVPRIGDGAAGQKQLVEVKEGGKVLAEILKTKNKNEIAELLGEGGLPPLPGLGRIWVQEKNGGYPDKYPCRIYT